MKSNKNYKGRQNIFHYEQSTILWKFVESHRDQKDNVDSLS